MCGLKNIVNIQKLKTLEMSDKEMCMLMDLKEVYVTAETLAVMEQGQ